MWCWRRMEKISWTDRLRNKVLQRVREERNILLTIKRRKDNWIGKILRRKCLLYSVIEGQMHRGKDRSDEKTERRLKQLLDDIKKSKYGKLKEEALDRALWRYSYRRVHGPVVRQTTE
jgi:hypothetical protein